MKVGGFRPAVVHRDANEDVRRRLLRVFRNNIEIAVLVEGAGVDQFELRIEIAAASVLLDELRIGKRALRIFIERLQVGMRGRRVQVVVALLDVLAVIPFAVGQAEQAFFQNRIAAVPERQRKAQ